MLQFETGKSVHPLVLDNMSWCHYLERIFTFFKYPIGPNIRPWCHYLERLKSKSEKLI